MTGRAPRDEAAAALNDLRPDSDHVASRPAYLFLLLVIGLHFTLGTILQVANPAFGISFGELFFFAGLTWLMVRGQNFSPADFLALRLPPARVMAASFAVAVAGFFVAGGVNAINRWIVGPEIAARYDLTGLFQARSTFEAVLLVVGVSVLAPLGEELVFRGYLYRILGARLGIARSVLITSVLFAVIHFNPASILALFALGLVFAFLRLKSGSIWPAILAHAIQNGIASALVLSGLANESPDELPVFHGFLLVAFSLPFLLFALRFIGPAIEDHVSAVDPESDHRFRISRIVRPLAVMAAAAVAALGLFLAVDGEVALARLQRAAAPTPAPAPPPAPIPAPLED